MRAPDSLAAAQLRACARRRPSSSTAHVAWLAWESRRHAGLTVPTWEKFRDSVADIDFESENDIPLAEEAPPTV